MTTWVLPTCDVLGVRCAVGDVADAADAVIDRALSGAGGYGVFCNVHVLMTARRQPEVMRAVEEAWTVFPDGAPVAWFQRQVGRRGAERIGGPDLMRAVFDRGRARGLRHALFGSTPTVVDALAIRLRNRFPGVEIVKAHAPARGEEDDESLLGRMAAAQPHVVWCALGAPKQELWMARSSANLAPALVLGVGAAFDFHSGTKQRAPAWMRQSGLEWLHRLGREPRRLVVRYVTTNAAFVGAVAAQLARRKRA
jgi:N-acetylglucosaminyldiphosphoundecaprenol N-acetyl-beta-D-mannosaminyltransferase